LATRIDLDRRRTSGRFVRNLALSLSGGAVLTVLGAGTALADDGSAGTASQGAGAAHSGDAEAVGNRSATQKQQDGSVSGALGNLQVVDQTATVANAGAGVANTGGNRAVGNESDNDADNDQFAANALGGAVNSGSSANSSNGSALISTGNASAVGNQSNTVLHQSANGRAHGGLGGILVVNQSGAVLNAGVALADSGRNEAIGNTSDGRAGFLQGAAASAGLATNSAKARNDSDGLATIATGSASAVGNQSDTKVIQSTQGSAGGPDPQGLELLTQVGLVVNAGIATANTGGDQAVGNVADNIISGGEQQIGDGPPPAGPVGVAAIHGDALNASDGTAAIWTGPASATGNESTTGLSQTSDSDVQGLGASVVPQVAAVLNVGAASANSGDNVATGNASTNEQALGQTIPGPIGTDIGVQSNTANVGHQSDGSASIRTGAAVAGGNRSVTDLSQHVESNGGAFNLQPQLGVVVNGGIGQAISGDNEATGNRSDNDVSISQTATLPNDDPNLDFGAVSQAATVTTASDGSAAISTGRADAQGNDAQTELSQEIDPTGLVLNPQLGIVANVGVAGASTGDNIASGNTSSNNASLSQTVEVGLSLDPTQLLTGAIVASNNGEASASSDGTADIATGDAAASGNESRTALSQTANGGIDGLGLVLDPQVGVVANVGAAVATTGDNRATGNESENQAGGFGQEAWIASENGDSAAFLAAPMVVGSNQGNSSAMSNGSAAIHTGSADATGSHSETSLSQEADGRVSGLGVVLNTQVAAVANVGVAQANTGDNDAVGNTSGNRAGLFQGAHVASDNLGFGADEVSMTALGVVTASNSADLEAASDGDATVDTGDARAIGNQSDTALDQSAHGHAPGLLVGTQAGVVVNAGFADANTGDNFATGNDGDNDSDGGEGGGATGTFVGQDALILSGNRNFDAQQGPLDWDLFVAGPATATNTASVFDPSDGSATIRTGDAEAHGNVSSTRFAQEADSEVSGLGGVLSTQVAAVANVGLAVANTGENIADGNVSANLAGLDQLAGVGWGNQANVDFAVVGPATASNAANVGNTSDGTATVGTGSALATGNASTTNLAQRQTGDVGGLGLTLGTQVGAVANAGVGIANTGWNTATGNESENAHGSTEDGPTEPGQTALVNSEAIDPAETTLLGPATASNTASVTSMSDGEACICTGNAVASGNVSTTTLVQDLDLSTTSGFIVLTEVGGVLNAGLGLANTGVNTAVGNSSTNDTFANQISRIDDALLEPVDGPQTAANSLTLANTSDGAGHVGSGNASGTGNLSTTTFAQAAAVDSGFAVSSLVGGTTNAGAGIANSGLSDAMGNDSVNSVSLDQSADGSGLVANEGEGTNDSDGTAIVGDPQCCGDEDVPSEETPPALGLPRTGADLQGEAIVGLLLLLTGFALRRRSRVLAGSS
jgi:hypothetical protein